jgi:hypothetical protein
LLGIEVFVMRNGMSIVVVAMGLTCPASALAQPPTTTFDQLRLIVGKGDLVTVLDQTGTRSRGRIIDVRTDQLVIDTGGSARSWSADELREIRRRTKDSVLNGAIIGAAISGGLTSLAYLDNECRGDPVCAKAVVVYAVLGAAAGAGIDALIHANRLIYRKAGDRATWSVAPVLSIDTRRAGVQLSIGY